MTRLVLAGTSDARLLLERMNTTDVVASLAGATRAPSDLPCETRIGGFGGADGFRTYLQQAGITAVIDATHPFAAQMTQTAASVCKSLEIPHMILQRPEWVASDADDWRFVDHIEEIPNIIPNGATVFLGTGRQTLDQFSCLSGRHLLARVIDEPTKPFPHENGSFLVGTPPFSVEEEVALFKEKGIEWLVVKNAGGWKSKSKLDAAAELRLPMVMINRPELPEATVLGTVDEALNWIGEL